MTRRPIAPPPGLARRRHHAPGPRDDGHDLDPPDHLTPTPPLSTPEDEASLAEDEARLRSAIARLADERRLVLVMVEWNGMSGVEVARVLGTPVGTVWRRLHEARAEVRRALERGAQ